MSVEFIQRRPTTVKKRCLRDILHAIHQAMGEIISRINNPFVMRPVMRRLEDSVGGQIPHLGIAVLEILLHSQISLFWPIFPIFHVLELS